MVAATIGRDLTRAEMVESLPAAGYSHTSAQARKINTHPLIQRCGSNRYRILGDGHGFADEVEHDAAHRPQM